MSDSRPPNSKRRWYQFGVRTVLIAVLLLSLLLSWLRVRAARNRQALAELHRVALEISSQGGDIDCKYAERRPNGLEQLLGDPGVFDVQKVSMGPASEADLQLLRGLNGMLHSWELGLSRSGVTDAASKHLQTPTGLRELDLSTTKITDAGLKYLHGLTNFGWLNLHNTQVTDAGLKRLAGLTRLSFLDISDTQVTDAGLVHLKQLTGLRSLTLRATAVTGEGTWSMQQALPDCRVRR